MMEDNYQIIQGDEKCSTNLDADTKQKIQDCSKSKEGGELLAMYGDDTNSLKPKVQFIPTIQINGSQDDQKLMLKNLLKAICQFNKHLHKDNAANPSICDTN